jgi:hypothetical protein
MSQQSSLTQSAHSVRQVLTAYTNQGNPLQLVLKFGTTVEKGFVNSLSQVHECFNGHP